LNCTDLEVFADNLSLDSAIQNLYGFWGQFVISLR